MTPTREQVLAEPAGPRLNAWVAEFVLGCKVLHVPGTAGMRDAYRCDCEPVDCGWPHTDHHDLYLYEYSEDIAAAWEVLQAMRRPPENDRTLPTGIIKVFRTVLQAEDGFLAGWQFIDPTKEVARWYGPSLAEGDTAPLALCRAALLSVLPA